MKIGISCLLLACSITASIGIAHAATDAPKAEATFVDPATGLTWSRCYAGTHAEATLTNEEVPRVLEDCVGDKQSATWFAATNIARDTTIDGKKGWRLPTKKEWDSLLNSRTINKSLARKMFPYLASDNASAWVGDKDPFTLKPSVVEFGESWNNGNARAEFRDVKISGEKQFVILVLDKVGAANGTATQQYHIRESRFFKDPATGLTWVPKLKGALNRTITNYDNYPVSTTSEKVRVEGECPSDARCSSDEIRLSWWEAVSVVSNLTLDGSTGWRLPSRADLETILPKLNTAGYPASYEFLDDCLTTEAGKKAGNILRYKSTDRDYSSKGYTEELTVATNSICVVRGPSPDPSFAKLVERALTWKGAEDYAISDLQASSSAALAAKESEKMWQMEHERQKQQKAKADAYTAQSKAQNAKLAALRANPKRGDKAREGLVLEVKGDLVKLQQYKDVCVNESVSINSHNGKRDCYKWESQETGAQIWKKKGELNLPIGSK